jgi:hypothetical protein
MTRLKHYPNVGTCVHRLLNRFDEVPEEDYLEARKRREI